MPYTNTNILSGKKKRAVIKTSLFCILAIYCLISATATYALTIFKLIPDTTVYGQIKTAPVGANDTLLDIARRFDLGYNQIILANPKVDPWLPKPGSNVVIPQCFILPNNCLSQGIVVNLAEMRLYYFYRQNKEHWFATGPIGIAKEGFLTQLGLYTIRTKVKHPTWVVPPSVRKEEPNLPKSIPPGPDNPLGDYILRFSRLFYGIHGTNKPWGVGRRVSHGCIRMYPEDIKALFPLVPQGTLVQVIYQPIKVGWAKDKCWIQVFPDFDKKIDNPLLYALNLISQQEDLHGPLKLQINALKTALRRHNSIPVVVAIPAKQ